MSGLVYLQRTLCAMRALTDCFWKTFLTLESKVRDISHITGSSWQEKKTPFICNNFVSTMTCFIHVTFACQELVRQAGQAINCPRQSNAHCMVTSGYEEGHSPT